MKIRRLYSTHVEESERLDAGHRVCRTDVRLVACLDFITHYFIIYYASLFHYYPYVPHHYFV